MTAKSVLAELESLGTGQNRKVYARHGVASPMFGVSYANLGKLKKKIKSDHALAEELWKSGNHDARILATMVADPEQASSSLLDAWVKELDNYVVTDAFSSLASKAPQSTSKMKKWMRSRDEWISSAGWNMVTSKALWDDSIDDAFLEDCLKTIESKIHTSKNRVRHSMNSALISIGMRNAKLEKKALAAAKRIGRVEVDHGETGCKTPEAASYIAKAKARKSARTTARKPVRKPTTRSKARRARA